MKSAAHTATNAIARAKIKAAARISDEDIHAVVLAAIAGERERCAKVCETHAICYIGTMPSRLVPSSTGDPAGHLFAAAIRNLKSE